MDDLITIVTLTYRKFDHLFETIDSVLRQDYKNIEYIISDDGSPNFPEEKIREYIKEYIDEREGLVFHIIRHEKNYGTVKNMNAACRLAKGKIILPLACGDVFYSQDIISRVTSRMEHLGCKLLVTSRLAYDGEKRPLYYLPYRKVVSELTSWSREKQYEALITSRYWDMASGSVMYYTKEILDELNYFDEDYVLWEDGPFLKKYLKKYRLESAFDIVSIWYESGGVSSSKKTNSLMKEDIEKFGMSICENEINSPNKRIRKWVRYLSRRKNVSSQGGLILTKISFPSIMLETILYQLKRSIYKKSEIKQFSKKLDD